MPEPDEIQLKVKAQLHKLNLWMYSVGSGQEEHWVISELNKPLLHYWPATRA